MGAQQRQQGKSWEEVFELTAQLSGMYPEKNYPQFQFLPGRRTKLIKGNLDWTLIWPDSDISTKIGFFDTKSFIKPKFQYSDIDPEQLKKAKAYNALGVCAGFIVYFVSINRVVFYEGSVIAAAPRTSFSVEQAVTLGRLDNFDLTALFARPAPVPVLEIQG